MFARGHSRTGFTLVELMISMAVAGVVAALVVTYMRIATVLVAKNLSTNYSHNSMHKSLDWVSDRIQKANYIPVLLTTGTSVSLSGTGSIFSTSAAGSVSKQTTEVVGVYYDCLVGQPYVFPNTSGTISASATSLTVQYSTNVYANPPAPRANDVLLLCGMATITTGSGTGAVTATARPLVASAVVTSSGSYKSAAITLSGSFGLKYTWDYTASGEYQTAMLVHREAFIVMQNTATGNYELRFYPDFEAAATLASPQHVSGSTVIGYVRLTSANLTDLNDPSTYRVVSDQMGTIPLSSSPYPPFSEIVTKSGAALVGVDLRIRGTQYDNVLGSSQSSATVSGPTKEANEFSQFARVITVTPLREHPTEDFQ